MKIVEVIGGEVSIEEFSVPYISDEFSHYQKDPKLKIRDHVSRAPFRLSFVQVPKKNRGFRYMLFNFAKQQSALAGIDVLNCVARLPNLIPEAVGNGNIIFVGTLVESPFCRGSKLFKDDILVPCSWVYQGARCFSWRTFNNSDCSGGMENYANWMWLAKVISL